jgi:hypothetical protein
MERTLQFEAFLGHRAMWGWSGLKDGEPFALEDCETPRTMDEYQRISEQSLADVLRWEKSSEWEPIGFSDHRVSLASLTLPGAPLKCVKTYMILPGTPRVGPLAM